MFDFLNRRKADRGPSTGRRRSRGPITIDFEQLEGREMLSSGVTAWVVPSEPLPLRSMPRPIVSTFRPEGNGAVQIPVRPDQSRSKSRLWSLGRRFLMG